MKKHYYKDDIIEICTDKHLSVEEIFDIISKKYSEVWRSSIYRNVEDLVISGDLFKLVWIWKKAYFEANKGKHIHLIDNQTWKIFDLDTCIKIPNLPSNFKIKEFDIKIYWNFIS